MALTDAKVKNAKPGPKPVKLTDGEGMYLLVTPAGGKCWRMKYRWQGKEKSLALGTYPTVTLSDAREKRLEAKKLLDKGVDPSQDKKQKKTKSTIAAGNTFEVIARQWHASEKAPDRKRWNEETAEQRLKWLQEYLFGYPIASRPISSITPADMAKALEAAATRCGVGVARRIKYLCADIFDWAIMHGHLGDDNPANPIDALKKLFPPPSKSRNEGHYPAITKPIEVAQLLRDIDHYSGTAVVKAALRLAPYIFPRPGELRTMRWYDLELDEPDGPQWAIREQDMKEGEAHIVPLARQAVAIIEEIRPLTGDGEYVFPSQNTPRPMPNTPQRPMSENTINVALRRMDYPKDKVVGHSFRTTARTLIADKLKCPGDWIEVQLAHNVPDRLGRTYNRAYHLDDRRVMMQEWADYLDKLKTGGKSQR